MLSILVKVSVINQMGLRDTECIAVIRFPKGYSIFKG